jgi:hypothetical protein
MVDHKRSDPEGRSLMCRPPLRLIRVLAELLTHLRRIEKRIVATQDDVNALSDKVTGVSDQVTKVQAEVQALKDAQEAGNDLDLSALSAAVDQLGANVQTVDDINPDAA